MSTSRHASPSSPGTNEYVFLRSLLLLLWIAAVNLWLRHHLGFGWDDPGGISIVVAAAGTVLFVLDKAGNKRPEAWWAKLFEWLDLPLLCLLYIVISVPMSLFSSVTIANGAPDSVTARLTPAGRATEVTPSSSQSAPPSEKRTS
jgi:hypothetical protein